MRSLFLFSLFIFISSFQDSPLERKLFPSDLFFPPEHDEISEAFLPEKTEFMDPNKILVNSDVFLKFGDDLYHHAMRDLVLPGYVADEKQEPLCSITGGAKGEEIYFTREGLVCQIEKGGLEFNTSYSLIRESDRGFWGKGVVYYNIATVRIEGFVGKGYYARVKIENSRTHIKEGDLLVPKIPFDKKITITDRASTYLEEAGQVFSFSEEGRAVSGAGDFIFFNKGVDHGVEEGRILAIHRTNLWEKSFSQPSRYVVDDVFLIGKALIVHAGNYGSIAYILSAYDEVYLEDSIGSDWNAGFYQEFVDDSDENAVFEVNNEVDDLDRLKEND